MTTAMYLSTNVLWRNVVRDGLEATRRSPHIVSNLLYHLQSERGVSVKNQITHMPDATKPYASMRLGNKYGMSNYFLSRYIYIYFYSESVFAITFGSGFVSGMLLERC
jgi:hypothetical protein